MSDTTAPATGLTPLPGRSSQGEASPAQRYVLALVFTAIATLVGFGVREAAGPPSVAMIFVLAVVLAATRLGLGPAVAASIASVLAFDFFFLQPYYSLQIHSLSDIWSAGILLIIATVVSAVAGDARRKTFVARRAAERAYALHNVAHLVVDGATPSQLENEAAEALGRIFRSPCVILVAHSGDLELKAQSGRAILSATDYEAAKWSLENHKAIRGENFPFETSGFDFWPIGRNGAPRLVIGVSSAGDRDDWPDSPEAYVELVGAYLTAHFAASAG